MKWSAGTEFVKKEGFIRRVKIKDERESGVRKGNQVGSHGSFANMWRKVNRCMWKEGNESDSEREQIDRKRGEGK